MRARRHLGLHAIEVGLIVEAAGMNESSSGRGECGESDPSERERPGPTCDLIQYRNHDLSFFGGALPLCRNCYGAKNAIDGHRRANAFSRDGAKVASARKRLWGWIIQSMTDENRGSRRRGS